MLECSQRPHVTNTPTPEQTHTHTQTRPACWCIRLKDWVSSLLSLNGPAQGSGKITLQVFKHTRCSIDLNQSFCTHPSMPAESAVRHNFGPHRLWISYLLSSCHHIVVSLHMFNIYSTINRFSAGDQKPQWTFSKITDCICCLTLFCVQCLPADRWHRSNLVVSCVGGRQTTAAPPMHMPTATSVFLCFTHTETGR